jgi:biopolymer transport protein ExbD
MRMKRSQIEDEDDDAVNLTPMLDVVFIMLIFFIVTASFVKESGIDVNRPNAATAERKEKGNIIVAISEDGRRGEQEQAARPGDGRGSHGRREERVDRGRSG